MQFAGMETVIPVVTAVVTSLVTYLVAKNNNKKDLTINDRKLLSEDEKEFRDALMAEIERYRIEVKSMREEINSLRELNTELKIENQQLTTKVDELVSELKKFKEQKG